MIIVLDRKVSYYFLVIMSLIILSCKSSGRVENEVFESVLKQSLLEYDLYDSTLNKGVVVISDTSFLLSENDKEVISRHRKSIIKGVESRGILIDKLLSNNKIDVFQGINLASFVLKSELTPSAKAVGIVYLSSLIMTEKDLSSVLFFYRFSCGSDCGSGNIVFAKKDKGKWVLVEVYPLYMI